MKKRVLVVAPHPDDETLGCGGTLLKHNAMGDKIFCLFVTNISIDQRYGSRRIAQRQREIDSVAKEYGMEKILKLDYPAAELDTIPLGHLVEKIQQALVELTPSVVYIPNRGDIHSDHTITFTAAISAIKTFRCPFVQSVMMYETVSESEFAPPLFEAAFLPNSFSDISDFLAKKIEIMQIYKSELGAHPFPRSIENITALATLRGATAGFKYAEAFMMIKERW